MRFSRDYRDRGSDLLPTVNRCSQVFWLGTPPVDTELLERNFNYGSVYPGARCVLNQCPLVSYFSASYQHERKHIR